MSSTNRGSTRHGADYYTTPIPAICQFLKAWGYDLNKYNILDPCAGGDDFHPMSYPTAINQLYPSAKITTIDIRQDSLAAVKCDYLQWRSILRPDVIITNPPFNIALDVIKKARQEADLVVMLLRLNFLGGKARGSWMVENMPSKIFVHSKRMKFLNTSGTDSIEYAHFVWDKNYKGPTQLELIL